jgi:hypothetical protein
MCSCSGLWRRRRVQQKSPNYCLLPTPLTTHCQHNRPSPASELASIARSLTQPALTVWLSSKRQVSSIAQIVGRLGPFAAHTQTGYKTAARHTMATQNRRFIMRPFLTTPEASRRTEHCAPCRSSRPQARRRAGSGDMAKIRSRILATASSDSWGKVMKASLLPSLKLHGPCVSDGGVVGLSGVCG